MRAIALTTALALLVAGCSTSYSITRNDKRVAHVHIESEPPGAMVAYGDRSLGRTPVDAKLDYAIKTTEIYQGTFKTGLMSLLLGLATVAAGIGLIMVGKGSDSSAGSTLGYTFGGLLTATGGLSASIGAIFMGVTPYKQVITAPDPETLDLALRYPDDFGSHRLRVRRKSGDGADFTKIGRLSFHRATQGWEAPSLPPTLELRSKRDPGARIVGVATPAPSRKADRMILAVFDVEDKGAHLSSDMLARLSDYLTMRLAAFDRFKVIPRDQLKARLTKARKESYKKCHSQSCQIEIGKELAAQKTLATVVVKLGSHCTVSAVVYDLKTSSSDGGASAVGGCSEDAIVANVDKVVLSLGKGGK